MVYDDSEEEQKEEEKGRCVTVRFTGDQEAGGGGDLDVWVEEGESVGSVKDKVSFSCMLRPPEFSKGSCRVWRESIKLRDVSRRADKTS